MHASLGAHIPISVHPSSFVLLSTATHTQPARELSNAQLGTPNRVLRRSRMSSYSLPLPASVMITRNSFGSVWTSSCYSAQPPAPNPHESSPMHSLVHPIGSCKGPACVAHPYPFLSVSVTRSSIELHYYIASGRAASGWVTLLCRVSLHRVSLHKVTSHWVASHWVVSLSCVGTHCIGTHCIGSHRIGSRYIGSHRIGSRRIASRHIGLCHSPC